MILLMVGGIAFAEESVQIDSEQSVYEEQVADVDEVPVPAKTTLDEMGDSALEPLEAEPKRRQ